MIGGSYGGFNQWSIVKEFPPHLVSITPTAAAHLGIDFPAYGGIGVRYQMAWLSFTSGQYTYSSLFGDSRYWNDKYRAAYLAHVPFAKLDSVVGNPSAAFQKWQAHPAYDEYWAGMAPSPEQLARLEIPIFTRTGIYDGDQIGAMEHYRNHMKHGSPTGKAKHFLMIGPWDHAGTRVPQKTFGGLTFSEKSVLEMEQLEADWFDWTMGNGPQPKLLPKRVAYYVTGAEEWKYADSLEELGRNPATYYLTSPGSGAADVFQSGSLVSAEPRATAPDEWTYDPLDTAPGTSEPGELDYTEQWSAMTLNGRGVIYHTEPFERETEITGFPSLSLWLTLDVPDSDLGVGLYEITREGKSILLTDDALRLRYRESRAKPVLLTPGTPTRVNFTRFRFMSRRIAAGSRIRLVIQSPNSIQLEKNYNSGRDVAWETAKDARTAHIKLHHEAGRWSTLALPVVR
jgi:putative CocE/NonD family hydrolase